MAAISARFAAFPHRMPGDSDDWRIDQNGEPDTAVCFAQRKGFIVVISSPEREVFHSVGLH